MLRNFRPSAFVPPGFHVESAVHDGAMTVITVRHMIKTSRCPDCTAIAERIHSRFLRRLADLPLAGRQVRLVVVARRFRCDAAFCRRAIFTERFSADVLAPWARRTARLDCLVHHLGLALGGRPAPSFARRLMLPVSNDTLLRVVRRRGRPPIPPPIVVGIDDWASKPERRSHRLAKHQGGPKGGSSLAPQGFDACKKVTGGKRHILVDTARRERSASRYSRP